MSNRPTEAEVRGLIRSLAPRQEIVVRTKDGRCLRGFFKGTAFGLVGEERIELLPFFYPFARAEHKDSARVDAIASIEILSKEPPHA